MTTTAAAAACGVIFERLSDGAEVACILESGHTCAHAFGPDVVETSTSPSAERSAPSVRSRRRFS